MHQFGLLVVAIRLVSHVAGLAHLFKRTADTRDPAAVDMMARINVLVFFEIHACLSLSATLATEQTSHVLCSKLSIKATNSVLTPGFRFLCKLRVWF
jgi:uncharacterized membrane protein